MHGNRRKCHLLNSKEQLLTHAVADAANASTAAHYAAYRAEQTRLGQRRTCMSVAMRSIHSTVNTGAGRRPRYRMVQTCGDRDIVFSSGNPGVILTPNCCGTQSRRWFTPQGFLRAGTNAGTTGAAGAVDVLLLAASAFITGRIRFLVLYRFLPGLPRSEQIMFITITHFGQEIYCVTDEPVTAQAGGCVLWVDLTVSAKLPYLKSSA